MSYEKYYPYWEKCVKKLEVGRIDDAICYASDIATKLTVNDKLIKKIFSINLLSYEKKIDNNMAESIKRAKNTNSKALCLYYSLDNGFDSTIYICKDYTTENNSWIGVSGNWIDIGKARGFSGIYKKDAESAFFADDISSGICILLMLRITVAFYNVAIKYKDCGLKLCVTCTEDDFVNLI